MTTAAWVALLFSIGLASCRMALPLLMAALGGLFSERSGVINIALEGLLLIGAFFAAAATLATGSLWIGLAAGAAAGAALAALYGLLAVYANANQIVAGTAINLFAFGLTPFLCKSWYDSTSATPAITVTADWTYAPFVIAALVVIAAIYVMRKTSLGLWIRSAGENPEALAAAGINVRLVRMYSVIVSGILAGAGGSFLALFLASGFTRNMTAGRGFMALAALIFGKWEPRGALIGCLVFGLMDALQIQWQGQMIPGTDILIPTQAVQAMPYLMTLVILSGFVGRARAPKAIGQPLV